ncbi:hypothetical protein CFP56_021121 [Quercus suber]|uniref:Uncharacterized protein n=1 Tax=Quercus suber TaxID=58331 RepID=A0AAW0KEV9_QUESU
MTFQPKISKTLSAAIHALISLRQYTSYSASARATSILMLKIGSLDSLTLLSTNFANNTFAEQGSFLQSSFFFSFSHLRLLHFGLHSFSKIEKVLSFTTFASKPTTEESFIKIVPPLHFLQAELFHKRKASFKCVDQRVTSLPFLVPSSPFCIHTSLFGAATDMGKCIVVIVEDFSAPKIINTLVPLLFALRAVSNSSINSGSAAKVIFPQNVEYPGRQCGTPWQAVWNALASCVECPGYSVKGTAGIQNSVAKYSATKYSAVNSLPKSNLLFCREQSAEEHSGIQQILLFCREQSAEEHSGIQQILL